MSDERFSWASAYQEDQRKQDARAEACLDALGDWGPLEQRLRAWWALERAQPHEGDWESFLPAAGERLARMCADLDSRFKPLVEVLPSALKDSSHEPPEQRAAQKLIGRSLALAIAHEPPDVAAFDQAVRFLRGCWTALNAFLEAFVQAVPQHLQRGWTPLLGRIPSELSALLDSYSYRVPQPLEQLQEGEQRLRARGLAAYLWERYDERCSLKDQWTHRCRVLLAFDPGAFTSVVESFPLRELRTDLLRWLRLSEDKEALLRLLRTAPPVFAVDGWTGQVVALLTLELAIEYMDQLHAAVKRAAEDVVSPNEERKARAALMLPQLESTELPQWLRDVFTTVLQREDGRRLLLLLAAHLIGKSSRPRSWRRNTWSSLGITLDAMESHLGPRPTAEELKAVARSSEAHQGTVREQMAYLLTAALFADDARGTWEWYVELLQTFHDDLRVHIQLGSEAWVYVCLGGVLLKLADPLMEWSEAWRRLFIPDRERARFAPFDLNTFLPSVHLVLVGLGLLHHGDRVAHLSADKAEKLWRELRRAILILTQGSVDHINHVPRYLVGCGFELAPGILVNGWPLLLDQELAWMKGSPERQVYVADALMRGGVPRDDVLAQMTQRGCDPLAALDLLETRLERDANLASAGARLRSPQGTK